MPIPLIQKSIRWRLLFYIIGIILILRAGMSVVHIQGEQELIRHLESLINKSGIQQGFSNPGQAADFIKVETSLFARKIFLRETLLAILVLGVLVAILLRVIKHFVHPIAQLTGIANEMAKGNFSEAGRLPIHLTDEVGDLARSFKLMSDQLLKNQAALQRNIEEALAAERKLKLFFENAMDMLAIEGFDAKIIDINQAYAGTLGYTPGEMIGRSCIDFFHPDDLDASLEKLKDLKTGKPVLGFENRMRHKNGSYRRIGWNIVSDPAAARIYVIGWDVTDQRNLEDLVVRVTAEEQERMARDLHDSVGQLLTGLAFKAKLIEEDLKESHHRDESKAAELVKLANRAIEETRAIARGIDPVELQHGLIPSLEYLAHSTSDLFDIDCTFKLSGDEFVIEKPKAVHLYRIAQEAVNNAMRHGQASSILISLVRDKKNICLTIQDDGLTAHNTSVRPLGQGTRIMHYRAKLIGGTITYEHPAPGGLVIKCIVPIPESDYYITHDQRDDRDKQGGRS